MQVISEEPELGPVWALIFLHEKGICYEVGPDRDLGLFIVVILYFPGFCLFFSQFLLQNTYNPDRIYVLILVKLNHVEF